MAYSRYGCEGAKDRRTRFQRAGQVVPAPEGRPTDAGAAGDSPAPLAADGDAPRAAVERAESLGLGDLDDRAVIEVSRPRLGDGAQPTYRGAPRMCESHRLTCSPRSRRPGRSPRTPSQRLQDAPGIDRHGPRLLVGVDEVEHQRLDVAVEDEPDHLALAVHHRAARVAADDVGRGDEVERRLQVELVLPAPASASAGRTARCCRAPRRARTRRRSW